MGPVVATELPELGRLNGCEIAALVGVALLNRDRGRYQGQHRVWGGRASVHTILYMVTVTATHDFHTRLCRRGQPCKAG